MFLYKEKYYIKDSMIYTESQEKDINLLIDIIFEDNEIHNCNNCKEYEEVNNKCNMGVSTNLNREIDEPSVFYCARHKL